MAAGRARAALELQPCAPPPAMPEEEQEEREEAAGQAGATDREAPPPPVDGPGAAADGGEANGTVDAEKAADTPEDLDRIRVRCWACTCLIQLPREAVPEGLTAADIQFECGGCKASNLPHSVGELPPRDEAPWRAGLKKAGGRGLMLFVPVLVVYIGLVGLTILGPACRFPGGRDLHLILAAFFEFQILFNYFATALGDPGHSAIGVEFGSARAAASGRLGGFELCRRCSAPRPQRAHHCSTCGRCTNELDHHCIYVNNCVGYNNRRNFVLFCTYGVLGCVYPLLLLIAYLWLDPDGVARIGFRHCAPRGFLNAYSFVYGRLPLSADGSNTLRLGLLHRCLSFSGMAFSIFVVADVMVVIMVSVLLGQQMYFMAHRSTMLSMMNGIGEPIGAGTRLETALKVMGNVREILGPPGWWIWPRRGPLPPRLGGRDEPAKVEPAVLPAEAEAEADGGGGAAAEEKKER